jgi:hypothetical protein
MIARKMIYVFALLALAAFSFGCKKSQPEPATPEKPAVTQVTAAPAPVTDDIVRIHWLGKKKISADTNAVNVMQVWNMPESVKLQVQTLDKLSTAPWRLLRGETNQSSNNLLRPLLDDLVEEESLLEVRKVTNTANSATEMILAVHLNDERAAVWETNLAMALQSLTGILPTNVASASRWSLKKHHTPNLIEFTRAGEWLVVGAAQDHNALLDEILARIERDHAPVSATNVWVDTEVDLPRVASDLGIAPGLGIPLPKVSLHVSGEAQDMLTRGEWTFPNAEPIKLVAWNIPTNLIGGNLTSFTVVRGFGRWLSSSEMWNGLQIGPPPDQFCVWAIHDFPMQTYFDVPLSDASNTVSRFSDLVLKRGAPWFATNGLAVFQRSETFNGLSWHGLPYVSPFLQSTEINGAGFAFGGCFQAGQIDSPFPSELLKQVFGQTNLVYYDWELTGSRNEQWIYLGQFMRWVSGKAQLTPNSAGQAWLKTVVSQLGNCGTEMNQIAPGKLSFVRKSSLGFTALEWHLLIDWLESPDFPRGLHTFQASPPSTGAPQP